MPRRTDGKQFSLGDDGAGRHTLNLGTGRISTAPPRWWSPMKGLTRDEVTPANLARVFEQAFFRTRFNEDGGVSVHTDAGWVMILVGDENRFLRFMAIYDLRDDADDSAKLLLISRANMGSGFARFYLAHPTRLVADCDVPFDSDIPLRHMFETFRQFHCSVWSAMKTCDEDGIVAG